MKLIDEIRYRNYKAKIVKITNEQNSEKSKETTGKRFENKGSSLGQVKERSYKRPGR